MNVASQEGDPESVLNYFRKMAALRKSLPALIYGTYTLIDANNPAIYAYTRTLEEQRLLVLLNFTSETASVDLSGINFSEAKVLIGNYTDANDFQNLRGCEALVLTI